jgi:hypothetical protein
MSVIDGLLGNTQQATNYSVRESRFSCFPLLGLCVEHRIFICYPMAEVRDLHDGCPFDLIGAYIPLPRFSRIHS